MIQVVVGSKSLDKIEATKEGVIRLGIKAEVFGVEAESEQNAQPQGFDEMFDGALMRARKARLVYPSPFAVGIENGIIHYNWITIDFAVIVVITPTKKLFVSTSSGVRFPEKLVREARVPGFKDHTVGEVIAEKLGGEKTDPHKTLTHGKISRKDILVEAVRLAFAQIPDLDII